MVRRALPVLRQWSVQCVSHFSLSTFVDSAHLYRATCVPSAGESTWRAPHYVRCGSEAQDRWRGRCQLGVRSAEGTWVYLFFLEHHVAGGAGSIFPVI